MRPLVRAGCLVDGFQRPVEPFCPRLVLPEVSPFPGTVKMIVWGLEQHNPAYTVGLVNLLLMCNCWETSVIDFRLVPQY
jgi:hypothetical protein